MATGGDIPRRAQFNDARYELFKSTMKYDGDIRREQHQFPSAEELPA